MSIRIKKHRALTLAIALSLTMGGTFLAAPDAQAAEISGKTIDIDDSYKGKDVINGSSSNTSAIHDNVINHDKGVSVYNIWGGLSGHDTTNPNNTATGAVFNNEVHITNGTVGGQYGQYGVYGGFSNSSYATNNGGVHNNLVSIVAKDGNNENVTIKGAVYGGGVNYGAAYDNTVSMNGGYVSSKVYGAYSIKSGNLENNHVSIYKGKVGDDKGNGDVYGAWSSSGSVTKNTVVLGTDGDTSNKPIINGNVVGGLSSTGRASENTVTMYYGDGIKSIIGGQSTSGGVSDNHVYMYNGFVNNDVIGGLGTSANANKNTVDIKGGTIKGRIIGGSSENSATGNTVTISGGSITVGTNQEHFIAGGVGITATDNTVEISGGEIASEVSIYGGYYKTKTSNSQLVTDNTLNLTNHKLTGNTINNFDRVNLEGGNLDGNALENVNHITAKSGISSLTKVSAKRSTSNGLEDITIKEGAELVVAGCAVDDEAQLKGQALWMDSLINNGTLTLASGQLHANNFTASAGSVFNVYAEQIKDKAAVIGVDETVKIDPTATLFINGKTEYETDYKILQGKGVTATSDTYDTAEHIKTTDGLLKFENKYDAENSIYYVRAEKKKPQEVIDDGKKDPAIIPAELTTIGAVSHATQSALLFMADAVLDHVAPAIELHPEPETEEDTHLWVHYSHSKEEATDRMLGSKSTSYDLQLNSYTVGRDVYQHDTDTVGVALSYAKGDALGLGGEARTENDAEFYGFTVYGRKDDNKFTYLSDFSYIHGENDLKQTNLTRSFTGKTKSDALSLGFTAMERIDRGEHRFVPYAGLRYLNVSNKDYYDSFGMRHASDSQNILLIPVGVKYTAEIPSGDWMVKPLVDLRYTWGVGDRETNEVITYQGASTSFDYLTRDSGLFSARLGVTAEKKAFAVGLAYERQVGDTVRADRFLANMNFKF